jgi:two-component system OmpR family response regulator
VNKEKPIQRKNAMIIEDEKDLSYLLAVVLRKNNLSTDCVYSINEAKSRLKKINPSVIFIDNHLPDGFGSDFIIYLKSKKPYAKIIMITAHDAYSEISKALENGADYFISKPFNAATIKTMLDILKSSAA